MYSYICIYVLYIIYIVVCMYIYKIFVKGEMIGKNKLSYYKLLIVIIFSFFY